MMVNSLSEDQKPLQPDCLVLGVKPGVSPSPKPPVRIFLGTQPEQYRAERVFFWSIEQVRDPSRVYEIYLMKDLEGFDRRGWTTGFTNYRFAIPHLAGGAGRAIFNDVDEAYFGDPAELFDLRTRALGGLLHELGKYRLRLAGVVADASVYSDSFRAFLKEARRGSAFRFFPTREEAIEGLDAD